MWRLLRCNPFSMGGIDFVPDKFTFRVEKYNYFTSDELNQKANKPYSNDNYENK